MRGFHIVMATIIDTSNTVVRTNLIGSSILKTSIFYMEREMKMDGHYIKEITIPAY